MSTFEQFFRCEQDCRRFLERIKYPGGVFTCSGCGCTRGMRLKSRDIIQCSFCDKQTSLTAGTFLHGVRTPLLKIFKLSWEVCAGKLKSAAHLARELNLAYSTTWEWIQKVRTVMKTAIASEQPIEIEPEAMHELLFRRSLETPPGEPTRLTDYEALREHPPGNHGTDEDSGEPVASAVCALRAFVRKTFHGISRKYSQMYAIQLGFILLNSNEPQKTLATVLRHNPVPRWAVRQYSSPKIISIPARAIRKDTCMRLWRGEIIR